MCLLKNIDIHYYISKVVNGRYLIGIPINIDILPLYVLIHIATKRNDVKYDVLRFMLIKLIILIDCKCLLTHHLNIVFLTRRKLFISQQFKKIEDTQVLMVRNVS